MATDETLYWFSKNRDKAFGVGCLVGGVVVGCVVGSGHGLKEAAQVAELMIGPSAVFFSVAVLILHWTTVRDGTKRAGERIGAERRRAAFRWWGVAGGALAATPINVAAAVFAASSWVDPVTAGVLLALMTMCNLLVLGLVWTSLADVVHHGHGDSS